MTGNFGSTNFRPLLPNAQAWTPVPKRRSVVKAACEACRRRKAKVCDLLLRNHHKANSASAMPNDPVALHVSKAAENASIELAHQNRELRS